MERRHFLKLAFGFAAGAAALAASARAAPLVPHPLAEDEPLPPSNEDARPAVTGAAAIGAAVTGEVTQLYLVPLYALAERAQVVLIILFAATVLSLPGGGSLISPEVSL